MSKEHCLIFVPGIGDNNKFLTWTINRFQKYGFKIQIHTAPWQGNEQDLKSKLERLISKIDKLSKDGQKITLIGISAGASLVLNAYSQRRNKVDSVVSICGRLRSGKNVFPSLKLASAKHPAFRESVDLFEKVNKPTLTEEDGEKILIIRAFLDELVPNRTSSLNGATNIKVPLVEHSFAIYLTLIFFRKTIIDFIKNIK